MLLTPDNLTPPIDSVGHEIAIGEITIDTVREGHAYWLKTRGTRAFPARDDIRPAEMKRFLPNIILVRVLDGGADFQFRVVGQASVAAHGFNPVNWRVADLDRRAEGYSSLVRRVFAQVCSSRAPYASRGVLEHVDRGYRSYESLYMPLGPDDRSVDHIFTVVGYSGDSDAGVLA